MRFRTRRESALLFDRYSSLANVQDLERTNLPMRARRNCSDVSEADAMVAVLEEPCDQVSDDHNWPFTRAQKGPVREIAQRCEPPRTSDIEMDAPLDAR